MRATIACVLLGLCASSMPALSQAAVTHYDLNIQRQPLDQALKEFAHQTGLQVARFSDVTRGVGEAGPLVGNFTSEEALGSLLAQSGLSYRLLNSNTIAIIRREESGSAASPEAAGAAQNATQARAEQNSKDDQKAPGSFWDRFRLAQTDRAMVQGSAAVAAPSESSTPAGSSVLEEVVVTAQKREERLRDVPISIAVLSAKDMQARNITSLDDLAGAVPDISIDSQGSYFRRIFLRGVSNVAGVGNTPLIGMYLDEADVTSGAFTQLDIRTYDVERVEVLRGPQGTLYGDGSAGGTLRFITKSPQLDAFAMTADVAALFTQDGAPSQRIESMVNVPVIEQELGLRIVGTFDHEGGWIDQPAASQKDINGSNVADLRIKALYQPLPQLSASLMALIHRNQGGINYGEDASGNYTQAFNLTTTPVAEDDYDLYNLTLNYDLPLARLLSTTTYLKQRQEQRNLSTTFAFTPPGTPPEDFYAPVSTYRNRAVSQELRLTSLGNGPLKWTLGGFYRDFQFDAAQPDVYFDLLGPPGTPLPTPFPIFYDASSRSWAAFADASYRIAQRLTLGAGLRYFKDREGYTTSPPPVPQQGDFHALSPRIYADYAVTSNFNAYASAAKGFRSGGFNSIDQPSYGPESVWTYELGAKTSFADGHVDADVSLFYSNYEDYQIFGVLAPPAPPIDVTSNGGTARIKGIEWDLRWRPVEDWTLSVGGDYANARFVSITATDTAYNVGDPLDFFPRYTFNLAAQRDFSYLGKSGFVRLDYNQQAPQNYRNRNLGGGPTPWYYGESAKLYMLNFNARIQWTDSLSFNLFAQNLLNDRNLIQPYSTATTVTESDVEVRSRPRTIGVGFGVKF